MSRGVFYLRIILMFLLVSFVCNAAKSQVIIANDNNTCSEDKNMIIGETTLEQLEQNPEFWIEYLKYYTSYTVDMVKLDEISSILTNRKINITAVIGTWCGDTKEQFPIMQKILDKLKNSDITIKYLGVNRDKLADKDISNLEIEFVPTFIFYENSRELGRIVETPETSMEDHIIKILNSK